MSRLKKSPTYPRTTTKANSLCKTVRRGFSLDPAAPNAYPTTHQSWDVGIP